MNKDPTSKENLALDLISERLGEIFIDRTPEEYAAIMAEMPPIKVMHGWVNDALKESPLLVSLPMIFATSKPAISTTGMSPSRRTFRSRLFEALW